MSSSRTVKEVGDNGADNGIACVAERVSMAAHPSLPRLHEKIKKIWLLQFLVRGGGGSCEMWMGYMYYIPYVSEV